MQYIKSGYDLDGNYVVLWQVDHYHYQVECLTKCYNSPLELVSTEFDRAVSIFDNIVSGWSKM